MRLCQNFGYGYLKLWLISREMHLMKMSKQKKPPALTDGSFCYVFLLLFVNQVEEAVEVVLVEI